MVVDDVALERGRIGELRFRWIGAPAGRDEKRQHHDQ
jgi:hypothetical protein